MQKMTITNESISTYQDPYLQTLHPSELDDLNDAGVEIVPCQKRESTPKDDPFTRYLRIADWLHERVDKEKLVPILGELLNSLN